MKKFRETENWKEKYKIFPSPKINSIKSFKSISFWPFKMNIMHLSLLFKCTFIEKCASLVAQLVKNPPATWETWVRSLGWGDPLEKGTATHPSILAWRIPWDCKESDMTERLSLSLRKKLQRVEMVEKSDGNYLITEVDFLVKCEHSFTVLCLCI